MCSIQVGPVKPVHQFFFSVPMLSHSRRKRSSKHARLRCFYWGFNKYVAYIKPIWFSNIQHTRSYKLTSNQPTETKKTLINNKRIVLTATILIICALAAAVLSYGFLTTNPTNSDLQNDTQVSTQQSTTPQPSSPTSWITKGTYAIYQGQAEILSISIQFNARMEVIDLNSTHINIQTSFDMASSFGSSENTTSIWVNREEMNFQPEGLNLSSSYTTQVTLPNLGTRNCIVYEYNDQDFSAAYYVDSTLHWPLKMVMTSPTSDTGQSYNMDVNLVDSNIPGL